MPNSSDSYFLVCYWYKLSTGEPTECIELENDAPEASTDYSSKESRVLVTEGNIRAAPYFSLGI